MYHWENHFICDVQVDLHRLLSMVPLPLSQGVVLSLLQQLACDINNDMSRKIAWMTDVATAINPSDPMITMHVRPIFEQVYQILNHQRSLPTITGADLSSTRLLLHVINSMLTTCKWFIYKTEQICLWSLLVQLEFCTKLWVSLEGSKSVEFHLSIMSIIHLDIVLFCFNLDTVSFLILTRVNSNRIMM